MKRLDAVFIQTSVIPRRALPTAYARTVYFFTAVSVTLVMRAITVHLMLTSAPRVPAKMVANVEHHRSMPTCVTVRMAGLEIIVKLTSTIVCHLHAKMTEPAMTCCIGTTARVNQDT